MNRDPVPPSVIADALAGIAAFGGDARRWPDEVAAAVHAAMATPEVAAALAAARDLDADLADWAAAPVAASIDLGAIAALPQPAAVVAVAPPRPLRRWFAGGALAAAAAAAIAMLLPGAPMPVAPAAPATVVAVATPAATPAVAERVAPAAAVPGAPAPGADAFAYVFTPTSDEEEVI